MNDMPERNDANPHADGGDNGGDPPPPDELTVGGLPTSIGDEGHSESDGDDDDAGDSDGDADDMHANEAERNRENVGPNDAPHGHSQEEESSPRVRD